MTTNKVLEDSGTNGRAIASFIFGILSIVTAIIGITFGIIGLTLGVIELQQITGSQLITATAMISIIEFILGIVGLILGIISLQQIKRLKQKGTMIAVSGMICSSLGILISIIFSVGYMIF